MRDRAPQVTASTESKEAVSDVDQVTGQCQAEQRHEDSDEIDDKTSRLEFRIPTEHASGDSEASRPRSRAPPR